MAICRCKSARCGCLIVGAAGIEVSGIGTARNPYTLDASAVELVGISNSSAAITITGDGTPGNPYDVSIDALSSVQRTVFTESGSWTKPPGKKVAHVVVIGGGGGGGTGGGSDVGGGGSGGSMSTAWIPLDLMIEAEIPVTVGAGGGPGLAGGLSMFGSGTTLIMAEGGSPGQRLGTAYGTYPAATTTGGTLHEGGRGGGGGTRDAASGAANFAESLFDRIAPTGGGIGGNPVAADTDGGLRFTAAGTAVLAGIGGSGGVANTPGVGGGSYGGGGGGGGGGNPGNFDGGPGGAGVVVVTCW